MCRHTVGLNWTAIGIEHVGLSDAQVLGNARQLAASLALTTWLHGPLHIGLGDVIGHNESLHEPLPPRDYAGWRCQTHADWNSADMARLPRAAGSARQREGVPLGGPVRTVTPDC